MKIGDYQRPSMISMGTGGKPVREGCTRANCRAGRRNAARELHRVATQRVPA